MKSSDLKVIDFLAKSPLKSFSAMLDVLQYLDGKSIPEEIEYELFNWALGDNPKNRFHVRIPDVPGIGANALFNFAWHCKTFNLIRRRVKKMRDFQQDEMELIVFYELTPVGKLMIRLLESLEEVLSKKSK